MDVPDSRDMGKSTSSTEFARILQTRVGGDVTAATAT